jgi:hypothetical protein
MINLRIIDYLELIDKYTEAKEWIIENVEES